MKALAENAHFSAIGLVASKWSHLEAVVDTWCQLLAEISPKTSVCFTSQIAGIGRKAYAYISLARLRPIPKALIEKLCDFATKAQRLSERRNRIVHDVWTFNHPEPPARLEASARKMLKLEFVPTPTHQLIKLVQEIQEHSTEFAKSPFENGIAVFSRS